MSRLHSAIVCTVALWLILINPINSVTYRVSFDPLKLMQPCKDSKIKFVSEYVDISNLTIALHDDGKLQVEGFYFLIEDLPNEPITIVTTFKQKLRGRWIALPYTFRMNDVCKNYSKKGEWWYENITKYFVGDQRLCPPPKNLKLPINFIAEYNLTMPTPLPEGEYIARSIGTAGNVQVCMDNYAELRQL